MTDAPPVTSRASLAIFWGLFVLTVALYSRAAFFPFCVIDDGDYLTKNPHITSGLTADAVTWAFTAFHAGNWHPVTWFSLMLDSQLFGLNPAAFHLVNVLLHALNASLLLYLLRSLTGSLWRSAFVAACFALHPTHVESVAWVAERKDVLSALFWMLTLICYAKYLQLTGRGWYLLALACYALGLMAKPMLVTLPVILLLLDFWPLGRLGRLAQAGTGSSGMPSGPGWPALLLEKGPFALLALGTCILTLSAQKPSISTLDMVPIQDRLCNALWALLRYLEKLVLPVDLAVVYPLVPVASWRAACAAGVLGGLSFWAVSCRKRHPYVTLGWFWFLVTLLPVLGLIQVGRQSMADRYTYLPFIGLFILAAWGAAELCQTRPRLGALLRPAAGAILLLLGAGSWIQLGYWRDNARLIGHTLAVTSDNHFAHYCLGLVHEGEKNPEAAIAEYRESLRIEPRDPMVHFDLAYQLDAVGKTEESIQEYAEALTLEPGFAQAHFSVGLVLARIGRIQESLSELSEAVRLEPDNVKFHNNLGVELAKQGLIDAAIDQFSAALRLDADDPKAKGNLAIALQQKNGPVGK